jgi:hypothetical protein
MNKTLLKQLIREEIKNVLEQMSDDKFAGSDPKAGSTIKGRGFDWDKNTTSNEAVKEVVLSNRILNFLEERGVIKASDSQKIHKDLTAFLKKNLSNAFDSMDKDPTQAIEKMADSLGMRVNVDMGQGYNKLEFLQKEDVDEKTFEMFIKLIEKLGYDVDLGQSVREYDFEPGERNFYPRIRF